MNRRRFYITLPAASLAGMLWHFSAAAPWLAVASLAVLPLAVVVQHRWSQRMAVALAYLLVATGSIVPSFMAFFPAHETAPAVLTWLTVALLLALPWSLARGPWSTLSAALLSGALGPLSIWPLAGLLFPGTGLLGLALLALTVVCVGEIGALVVRGRPAHVTAASVWIVLAFALLTNITALITPDVLAPSGWTAVNTRDLHQTGNDVFSGLRNTQKMIAAGLKHPKARVLVFPEAALNDMLPGTVAMVSQAVPEGQVWLVGAEDGRHDATWRFEHGKKPVMVSDSVLPMPVSMWRPWQPAVSYRPAWYKQAFRQDGLRVWSSICYEQVVPWSWVQALLARPDLVLLQSNAWWAGQGNPAPDIQLAQAMGWLRLMGLPSVSVQNSAIWHH